MRSPLSIAHRHVVHIACLNQFSAFSTTSPSACLQINSYCVSLSCLSGWRLFPPPLLKRYLVYYISADLENKVRHLWWPNFLQPNPTLCLSPQCAATQSSWSRNPKFLAFFLPKKWLDIKIYKMEHKEISCFRRKTYHREV